MSKTPIYPILLCGGSGTRLWPLSRKSYPKQFSRLLGQESLFQASARRVRGQMFQSPVVVTGDPFRFIVTEQLAAIEQTPMAILIEPEARNTAPAILAAALWVERQNPDAVLLALPSDHVITDVEKFHAVVSAAVPRALAGDIVTFGITPTHPRTDFGYVEVADGAAAKGDTPSAVLRFHEKPDADAAAAMVETGRYLWNAGIFLFTAKSMRAAFERHASSTLNAVSHSVEQAKSDLGFIRLPAEAWAKADNTSIDYGIMERANNISVMPFGGHWSDLGSWGSVWHESGPDAQGNVSSDRATAIECRNSFLRSETEGVEIVGIGLTDTIAIAMADAVLVVERSQAHRVNEAVTALKERKSPQAETFPVDHRPWGWFESLALGDRFQVKRIHVHPGAALSLQSHHHRAEHWIVVEGTARVTVGDEVKLIFENQSVYIPIGARHRMENPGKVPLALIEVQSGSYLGEDDIVRYEDVYSRT